MKKFAFVNDAAEREYKALPVGIQKDFGVSLSAIQKDETPFLTIRSAEIEGSCDEVQPVAETLLAYTFQCLNFPN